MVSRAITPGERAAREGRPPKTVEETAREQAAVSQSKTISELTEAVERGGTVITGGPSRRADPTTVTTPRAVSAQIAATRERAAEAARVREEARRQQISEQIAARRLSEQRREQQRLQRIEEERLQRESVGGRTLVTGEREFFLRPQQTVRPELVSSRDVSRDVEGEVAEVEKEQRSSLQNIISPVGDEFRVGPGGTIQRREEFEKRFEELPTRQQRLFRFAEAIPTGTEILAFSGRAPTKTPFVRGQARVIRGRDQKFVTDIITRARDPVEDAGVITISRQLGRDIPKGSVGAGRAFTLEKVGTKVDVKASKLVGISKKLGEARQVKKISAEGKVSIQQSSRLGRGIESRVAVQEIERARFREGLRIGVPRVDRIKVSPKIKQSKVLGFVQKTARQDVIKFVGTTRPTTRITRTGRITRRITTPNIDVDIGIGKFPTDVSRTGRVIRDGRRGVGTQKQISKTVSDIATSQVSAQAAETAARFTQAQTRALSRQVTGISPAAKIKPVKIKPTITGKAIQDLSKPKTTTPTVQTSGITFRTGLSPAQTSAVALSPRERQRTRQRTRLKTEQQVRQLVRPTQRQRFRQGTRLRLQQKLKLERRAPVPNINFKIGIPKGLGVAPLPFGLKKAKVKRKRGKKKAREDIGIAETFVERQFLLPTIKTPEIPRLRI